MLAERHLNWHRLLRYRRSPSACIASGYKYHNRPVFRDSGCYSSDPSTWDSASYVADPIDELEPYEWPEGSEFRHACISLLDVLYCIDDFCMRAQDARLALIQVSVALGLPSTEGRTVTDLADHCGITKQALSKGVTTFLRRVHLPPAFGLKSDAAKAIYRETNGVHHEPASA